MCWAWCSAVRREITSRRATSALLHPADGVGCTREFLTYLRRLRDESVSCEFSVGWAITERERAAITAIPNNVWTDAVDADGGHRDGAGLAEITGVLPARALAGYPAGTRVRIQRSCPWAHELAAAFARLAALPVPTG